MTKVLEKFERSVLGISIFTICFTSLINVICRTLFNFSLTFVEELNQYLIIALTFIGTSYGVRMARHIRMSALYDMLSFKGKKRLTLFIDLFCACLFFYLTFLSVEYITIVHKLGSTGPSLGIPMWIVYLTVPIGLFSSALLYLFTFKKNLTSEAIHLGPNRIYDR